MDEILVDVVDVLLWCNMTLQSDMVGWKLLS